MTRAPRGEDPCNGNTISMLNNEWNAHYFYFLTNIYYFWYARRYGAHKKRNIIKRRAPGVVFWPETYARAVRI